MVIKSPAPILDRTRGSLSSRTSRTRMRVCGRARQPTRSKVGHSLNMDKHAYKYTIQVTMEKKNQK